MTNIQFPVQRSSVVVALHHYMKWKKNGIKGFVYFVCDVVYHLFHGFVVVRPDCFLLFRLVEIEKQPAWFVAMAVGDLSECLACIPLVLPKIAFCRHGHDRLRICNHRRLLNKGKARIWEKAAEA